MKLAVVAAAGGAEWEGRLLGAWGTGEQLIEISRRCLDVVDLLAVSAAGYGRVALVAAELRHLDADVVDRLRASRVVPVAVVPRGRPDIDERMRALGIDHVVPADADPAVFCSVLVDAAAGRRADAADRSFADPLAALPEPVGGGDRPGTDASRHTGSVLAVWGPAGAPGRTTLSVLLADEIARLGVPALLIDADVYGGMVSAALGLMDESPGLAAACRATATGRFGPDGLAALCRQVAPGLRVLTGIAMAARWPELRAQAMPVVLDAACGLADWVIVDCGFSLETDEEISFDALTPRRNGATLAVLDRADVLVAIGSCDPLGMIRLVRGLDELRDAEIEAQPRIVLNRVRRTVVPGDPAAEVIAALDRFAGVRPDALLPFDPGPLDEALAAGRTLGEIRPASPLRRAAVQYAHDLTGIPVRPRRRHARR